MFGIYFRYLLLFVILVLFQILILNNIWFSGTINPQMYILVIILLPLNTPGWFLLITAFLLGLVIDTFSDSIAIHTTATVFMAFCRPAIIRILKGKIPDDEADIPSFAFFGTFPLIVFIVVTVLLHHTVLFFMEIFRFDELSQTLRRIALSSSISILFVITGFLLLEKSLRKQL